MAEVAIMMSGDDARVQAMINRQIAQQEKFLAKLKETSDGSKKLSEEEIAALKKKADEEAAFQKLKAQAVKVIASVTSAEERYAAAVAEANELKEKSLLTDAQHARRLQQLQQELNDATGATKKLEQAQREGEQAVAKADTTTKKYMTTVEKLQSELADVRAQYDRNEVSLETLQRAQLRLNEAQKHTNATVDSVKSLALQYVSLQAAMGLLNSLAQEFDAIQQSSLDTTRELAAAQQETIKNLTGQSFLQKSELLNTTVKEIQDSTGFKGQGHITQALGESISAGATVEEAKSAVKTAASLNRLTPDKLTSAATALIDIGRATGIKDAEKNEAFLLKIGAVSRTGDPDQLARSVGESLGNIMKTLPTAEKDPERAAREAGALYATLNQEANDVTGRSTSTAAIQFSAYLRKFFEEGGQDPASTKRRDDKIRELETKATVTDREKLKIDQSQAALDKANKDLAKAESIPAVSEKQIDALRKLQFKQRDAQIDLDTAKKTGLTPPEQKELDSLLTERKAFSGVKDPGDLQGRMAMLAQNKELQSAFLEKMPGEAAFKLPMEMLLKTGGTVFERFKESFNSIDFDPNATRQAVKEMTSVSPSLAFSTAGVQAQANLEQFSLDEDVQAKAEIAKIQKETLPRIRTGGISGLVQMIVENSAGTVREGMGGGAQGYGEYVLDQFRGRKSALESGGITPEEQSRVELINKQIDAINRILERLNQDTAAKSIEGAAKKMDEAANKLNQRVLPTVDQIRAQQGRLTQ